MKVTDISKHPDGWMICRGELMNIISTKELIEDKELFVSMLDSIIHRIEMIENAVIPLIEEKNRKIAERKQKEQNER